MIEVQNNLPNTDPSTDKETTDFYPFMSPAVNNKKSYLAYNRKMGYATTVRILMDRNNVSVMINELKEWRTKNFIKKANDIIGDCDAYSLIMENPRHTFHIK
ncbi:hypothetical protein [Pectobacterium wasabiae]|uniref:Uncharacterized protein n=1 Tax=Pectobacterium wasabiae TaxID=55208 RepID=A0AAW3ELC2_9GAMM|nr:hypothetical protein [Pectobacterium wasabiae]AOR65045.1 hypothetical protein A7983_17625 [Pectobacterium wasabiae CFBP 3304]EJS96472.1 Hypothetical protein Y17_0349 [Pectobacterium wasabiae CFBP 3304]KFX09689.1 hypothetical protein JV38_01860 [Pectobacterium wasabiae]KGA29891.1 hypothetical protein KU73_05585 [Pectobacterium wasabiae]